MTAENVWEEKGKSMSMNETPSGERLHIGIFGRRNAGKSSLINAITGQDLAIVSEVKGTTTDPVKKAMELLPLGPVVLIDTPGLDDEGGLGQKRMEKGLQMLRQTDVLLLVIAADTMVGDLEQDLLAEAKKRGLPYLIVLNKTDLLADPAQIDEKAERSHRHWRSILLKSVRSVQIRHRGSGN